eukprot:SAG31_NODE_4967_length_2829_cov_3.589744_1_plen_74_part_10
MYAVLNLVCHPDLLDAHAHRRRARAIIRISNNIIYITKFSRIQGAWKSSAGWALQSPLTLEIPAVDIARVRCRC